MGIEPTSTAVSVPKACYGRNWGRSRFEEMCQETRKIDSDPVCQETRKMALIIIPPNTTLEKRILRG
jgi:hypothetical protein